MMSSDSLGPDGRQNDGVANKADLKGETQSFKGEATGLCTLLPQYFSHYQKPAQSVCYLVENRIGSVREIVKMAKRQLSLSSLPARRLERVRFNIGSQVQYTVYNEILVYYTKSRTQGLIGAPTCLL